MEGEVDEAGNTEADTDEENMADIGENPSSADRFEPGRVVEFAVEVCT